MITAWRRSRPNSSAGSRWQLRTTIVSRPRLAEIVTHAARHVGICFDTANSFGCLEGPEQVLERSDHIVLPRERRLCFRPRTTKDSSLKADPLDKASWTSRTCSRLTGSVIKRHPGIGRRRNTQSPPPLRSRTIGQAEHQFLRQLISISARMFWADPLADCGDRCGGEERAGDENPRYRHSGQVNSPSRTSALNP